MRPTRYDLELTVIPDHGAAPGKVHIDAEVTMPTRVVWLNAAVQVHDAKLAGVPTRVIVHDDVIGLVADHELPTGALAIDLAFDAPIDHEKSRGIYSEKEGGEAYAYTFFEPIDARRAFPCFDEPAYKVPWKLALHIRREHVALGNAPVVRETDEGGGMKRVELDETKPLPSYLVAFVVGPFELVDDGVAGRDNTPIRFVVPKGRAGELGWAKDVTPRVVAALEDYFGMAYPYRKLDVAVVPRYWGTMEHPGIVAMGQPLTLIRPDQATRDRKEQYANILAHELSHYWFGDLVTMAWWDDTWLNEALGEWSDMNITAAVEPRWRVRDARARFAANAMESDEKLATHAIRREVTTREGIQASFDNDVTYFKGASVLRMFEAYAGADKWRDFIRGYLHAHAWGNASASDFRRELAQAFGEDFATAFDSFIDQPGVPLIRSEVRCTGKPELVLHESRALPAGVTAPSPLSWRVPVCMRYGDAKHANQVCAIVAGDATLPLDLCPTWIVPNMEANGYYRSSLDVATARALLDARSPISAVAKPTAIERIMIVADLRAMVERGELPLEQRIALAPVIAANPDPMVAMWAPNAARFRDDGLPDPLFHAARVWWAKAFGPLASGLTWQRAKGDSDERQQLRALVVPRVAETDAALGATATRLAEGWLASRTGVADDLVDGVLATAAVRGNAELFERYLDVARAPRDREEQRRMFAALGSFSDPALVARAQQLVLGHDLDLRDTIDVVYVQLSRRPTRDLALAFLEAHLDELLARMRDDEASWFLGAIARTPCDPDRRKRVGELVTPRAAKFDGAQIAVTSGLEASDQCIAELARERPALEKLLK